MKIKKSLFLIESNKTDSFYMLISRLGYNYTIGKNFKNEFLEYQVTLKRYVV